MRVDEFSYWPWIGAHVTVAPTNGEGAISPSPFSLQRPMGSNSEPLVSSAAGGWGYVPMITQPPV